MRCEKAAELKTPTRQRPKSVTSLNRNWGNVNRKWYFISLKFSADRVENSNENTEVEVIPLRLT